MTGDQADFLNRIKALLPPWFGNDETPILDGALTAPAATFAFLYQLIQYVRLQTRLATSTGGFLDLSSFGFFGADLPRNPGEADATYLARIKAALFPQRNTRPAMVAAIEALGCTAQIIEPWNLAETSALNVSLYLNVAGYLGSRTLNSQCFLIVTVPGGVTVSDAQIYAAINAVRPVAIIVWTSIVR